MIKILCCVTLVMVFSACSPSQAAVQTAIAQTMAANPTAIPTSTDTPSPVPTNTPTVTLTYTITPSQTPTVTFTTTPTPDVRIIDSDPRKFLLAQEDLPKEGLYYIPGPDWTSINTNEEVISNRGIEKGREYVINTGRVTGWWLGYNRGTLAVKMPKEIYSGVYLFKTARGAQLAMTKYNSLESNPTQPYIYIKRKMDLGDANTTYAFYKIDAGGQKNTDYFIDFTYRNVWVSVDGFDYKEDYVPPELIENLARAIHKKLQDAPLTNPEDAVLAK